VSESLGWGEVVLRAQGERFAGPQKIMKRQTVIALCVAIALCAISFCLGRHFASRNVITYSVNGWPTSFNRAWPTYGLPLAEDEALLTMLRGGNSTNAVAWLETMLDTSVYDAKQRREQLKDRDLQDLDKALLKVARYREEFPRPIDTSGTNEGNSSQVKAYAVRIAEQKEIDTFLHNFAGR
jgi:hypothetical protein